MKRVSSPPTVPFDADIYLVLDDFGPLGTSYRETDTDSSSQRDIIRRMVDGQYNAPRQVVAFNVAEGVARDVSEDIARAVADLTNDLPDSTRQFVEFYIGEKVR